MKQVRIGKYTATAIAMSLMISSHSSIIAGYSYSYGTLYACMLTALKFVPCTLQLVVTNIMVCAICVCPYACM